MYSAQFAEMLAQSVHAQNLADADRKRFANEPMGEPATQRTSFVDMLRRRLAHIALGPSDAAVELARRVAHNGSR